MKEIDMIHFQLQLKKNLQSESVQAGPPVNLLYFMTFQPASGYCHQADMVTSSIKSIKSMHLSNVMRSRGNRGNKILSVSFFFYINFNTEVLKQLLCLQLETLVISSNISIGFGCFKSTIPLQ